MTEKILILSFSILIILLFSRNLNNKWAGKNYQNLKAKSYAWYWFRVFKVAETKDNFIKLYKGLSVLVITIMAMMMIIILTNK
jgi:hypothetical protein